MYTIGPPPPSCSTLLLENRSNLKTPILSLSHQKCPLKNIHCMSTRKSPLKTGAKSAIVILAAAFSLSKFPLLPAQAEPSIATSSTPTPLTQFLESNIEAVNALKSLLHQKLESHEDEEALKLLNNLISAQPNETQWKFLLARLLGEMGRNQDARNVFEEILQQNPLSFEALFENALLMDRIEEEKENVFSRLEEALKVALEENKTKEARDVRLIMAQFEFLHKNVDGALRCYDELAREDPSDFRPYFCKGMIYSLLDRNNEAKEEFAKYRELSPKKFEVEGYLRSPLSKTKLFGTDHSSMKENGVADVTD